MPGYLHRLQGVVTRRQFERGWYVFSICLLIASLPFSKFGLSLAQFFIAGGWILERIDTARLRPFFSPFSFSFRLIKLVPLSLCAVFMGIWKGFHQFFRNKPALIFSSILLIHVAGLIFTTDFSYAIKDLRTKLPFLLLPLFISTSEAFSRKEFHRFMLFFILAILVRTGYNALLIFTHQYIDIRDVSRNVSHIVLGLLLSTGIFTLAYFSVRVGEFRRPVRILFVLMIAWFVAYLIFSQSFTGLSITVLTVIIIIPVYIYKTRKKWLRLILVLFTGILLLTGGLYLYRIIRDYYTISDTSLDRLEVVSSRGNPYIHNPYSDQAENGHYLWIYIQWEELRLSWNNRSEIPFDSLDKKKQPIAYTLVRFLTSKGWRKDADAVERLTKEEIEAIQKGVASVVFLEDFSVRGRIYEFLHGFDIYRQTGNPTGSSMMQRLEFWKASIGIISKYWLTGVGTGDMNDAFRDQYNKMHSKLSPDQRWRSHNQYLSLIIGFGLPGLLWFLLALTFPPVALKKWNDFFVLTFLVIAVLSMITEDTIESQTGVMFFVFFYTFFLFGRKEPDPL